MASNYSSPKKSEEVQGYIHEVSDVQMGQSGRRYFDFKIQNHTQQFTRVACFHPPSRDILKDKETSKTPTRLINLSPQKRKFERESNEYTMNKYCKIADAKNLTFPWKSVPPVSFPQVSVESINTGTFQEGKVVTVQAKVLSISEVQTVHSSQQNRDLRKADVIVADESGSIRICVWEALVDKVEQNGTYTFTGFRVDFYRGKFLNATKNAQIAVYDELIAPSRDIVQHAAQLIPKTTTRSLVGKILSVEIERALSCINCKKRIPEDPNETKIAVKCEICRATTLRKNLTPAITANVIIQDQDLNKEKFHSPMAVLKVFFSSLKNNANYCLKTDEITDLSDEQVAEMLLQVETLDIVVDEDEKKVISMTIV